MERGRQAKVLARIIHELIWRCPANQDTESTIGERLSNFKTLSLIAFQVRIRLAVVRKDFLLCIPGQFAPDAHGDIPEVACGDATVLAFDIGNGLGPRLDAVEQVTHMVDDGLQFSESLSAIDVVGIDREPFTGKGIVSEVIDGFTGNGSSVHKNPALRACEGDAGPRRNVASSYVGSWFRCQIGLATCRIKCCSL